MKIQTRQVLFAIVALLLVSGTVYSAAPTIVSLKSSDVAYVAAAPVDNNELPIYLDIQSKQGPTPITITIFYPDQTHGNIASLTADDAYSKYAASGTTYNYYQAGRSLAYSTTGDATADTKLVAELIYSGSLTAAYRFNSILLKPKKHLLTLALGDAKLPFAVAEEEDQYTTLAAGDAFVGYIPDDGTSKYKIIQAPTDATVKAVTTTTTATTTTTKTGTTSTTTQGSAVGSKLIITVIVLRGNIQITKADEVGEKTSKLGVSNEKTAIWTQTGATAYFSITPQTGTTGAVFRIATQVVTSDRIIADSIFGTGTRMVDCLNDQNKGISCSWTDTKMLNTSYRMIVGTRNQLDSLDQYFDEYVGQAIAQNTTFTPAIPATLPIISSTVYRDSSAKDVFLKEGAIFVDQPFSKNSATIKIETFGYYSVYIIAEVKFAKSASLIIPYRRSEFQFKKETNFPKPSTGSSSGGGSIITWVLIIVVVLGAIWFYRKKQAEKEAAAKGNEQPLLEKKP